MPLAVILFTTVFAIVSNHDVSLGFQIFSDCLCTYTFCFQCSPQVTSNYFHAAWTDFHLLPFSFTFFSRSLFIFMLVTFLNWLQLWWMPAFVATEKLKGLEEGVLKLSSLDLPSQEDTEKRSHSGRQLIPMGKQKGRQWSLLSGDHWQDWRNAVRLCQERLRLDIMKSFFTQTGIGHQKGLPTEADMAQNCQASRCTWTMLSVTWCESWGSPVQGQDLALDDFCLFQIRILYDSINTELQKSL